MTKTPEQKAAEKAAKDAAKATTAALQETATPAAKPNDPIVVQYRDHEGKVVERTFSKDVHGENFAAKADEFTKTNASKIVS